MIYRPTIEQEEMLKNIELELRTNSIYCDNIWMEAQNVVAITIMDGDWKHEHIAADQIITRWIATNTDMKVVKVNSREIGHSESDCYSADRFYALATKSHVDVDLCNMFDKLNEIDD